MVPFSPEQDSSSTTTDAAQTDHCFPVVPSSQVRYHQSLLALIENAAGSADVVECSSEPKTAVLTAADHVGNFERQAVVNVVDRTTTDSLKGSKIADPDLVLDQTNQG